MTCDTFVTIFGLRQIAWCVSPSNAQVDAVEVKFVARERRNGDFVVLAAEPLEASAANV